MEKLLRNIVILAGKISVVPYLPKYTKHVFEDQFINLDLAISLFLKGGLASTEMKKLLCTKAKCLVEKH